MPLSNKKCQDIEKMLLKKKKTSNIQRRKQYEEDDLRKVCSERKKDI